MYNDIILSVNNREKFFTLPVPPLEQNISFGYNNETFDTLSQGEIKLIGMPRLETVTISSFFPEKDYSFSREKKYHGMEYVEQIREWMSRRVPIRVIFSDKDINMAMTIDSFEYGSKDGTGDIYYSLSLSRFKFLELKTEKVS